MSGSSAAILRIFSPLTPSLPFYAPPPVFEHDKYNFQRFATSARLAAANNRSHNRHINYLLSKIFTEGGSAIKHIKYNAEILIPLHIGGITYLSSYTGGS